VVKVVLHILQRNGRRKIVEASLEERPCDKSLLAQGVRTFETAISVNEKVRRRTWLLNDRRLLIEYLVLELQKIVSTSNPNREEIIIVEDDSGLLTFKDGYCQHCKRKIIQFYGYCYGVIKKCENCKNLTTVKDAQWRDKHYHVRMG